MLANARPVELQAGLQTLPSNMTVDFTTASVMDGSLWGVNGAWALPVVTITTSRCAVYVLAKRYPESPVWRPFLNFSPWAVTPSPGLVTARCSSIGFVQTSEVHAAHVRSSQTTAVWQVWLFFDTLT